MRLPCRLVPLIAAAVATMGLPSAVTAQDASHWGLDVAFTPMWSANESLRGPLMNLEGEGTLEGAELTIGFVRGSIGGGDWGVSYVHKPFDDGATLVETDEGGATYTTILRDVYIRGVEARWFLPFVRFADRVQVGLDVGGGIGVAKGTVEETYDVVFPGPFGDQTFSDTFTYPANELLWSVIPLVKAGVQASIHVAPGLKIKISGGLNAPSTAAFRVGAVYLFGGE